MSQTINAIRDVMQSEQSMNVSEIMKKLAKAAYQMKVTKEELKDVLAYYQKLQVIFVDNDENVIFL